MRYFVGFDVVSVPVSGSKSDGTFQLVRPCEWFNVL